MKLPSFLTIAMVIGWTTAFAPPCATSQSTSRRAVGELHAHHPTRTDFLKGAMASLFLVATAPDSASSAVLDSSSIFLAAKAYSSNARNMDRISAGDFSGGSVYDNNPSSAGARRRRAMQGCKIPSAREEAADVLGERSLAEKDCNVKVMSESPDFMLTAMQTLDCPMCPYGIKESR